MTFETNDAPTGVDVIRRRMLSHDQFDDAAPMLAVGTGGAA